MAIEIKLKPCPFCGHKTPDLKFRAVGYSSTGYEVFVLCSLCRTKGPSAQNEEWAIEKWNERVKDV